MAGAEASTALAVAELGPDSPKAGTVTVSSRFWAIPLQTHTNDESGMRLRGIYREVTCSTHGISS